MKIILYKGMGVSRRDGGNTIVTSTKSVGLCDEPERVRRCQPNAPPVCMRDLLAAADAVAFCLGFGGAYSLRRKWSRLVLGLADCGSSSI